MIEVLKGRGGTYVHKYVCGSESLWLRRLVSSWLAWHAPVNAVKVAWNSNQHKLRLEQC